MFCRFQKREIMYHVTPSRCFSTVTTTENHSPIHLIRVQCCSSIIRMSRRAIDPFCLLTGTILKESIMYGDERGVPF